MATYAVDITISHQTLVFVDAESPKQALEVVQTDEGWEMASRYDPELPRYFDPRTMSAVEARPMD